MKRFLTHFSNKERSKIYHAKNKIKDKSGNDIPKTYTERQKIILRYYKKLKAIDNVFCPALDDYVTFKTKGQEETVRHAAKSIKSTKAALNLKEIIENATYIKRVRKKPYSKNQQCFKWMHILVCPVKNIGYAKLEIGEFFDIGDDISIYTHYCVTHVSVKAIKA